MTVGVEAALVQVLGCRDDMNTSRFVGWRLSDDDADKESILLTGIVPRASDPLWTAARAGEVVLRHVTARVQVHRHPALH
jgi:hypothetical protein